MSRPATGCGLIVAGLVLVGVGVWLKRAFDQVTLMVVLHTIATVGLLIPGLMTLVWRPDRGGDAPPPDAPPP